MKNFWLERKEIRTKPFVKLRSSYGTSLEFVDLSHQTQHNSRYKEYDRLNFLTKSGHIIEMVDYPEIYGWKTPEKHTIGYINEEEPPKCTNRWKRIEIQSSMGTSLIMKDDNLPCGQWAKKEEDGRIPEDQ